MCVCVCVFVSACFLSGDNFDWVEKIEFFYWSTFFINPFQSHAISFVHAFNAISLPWFANILVFRCHKFIFIKYIKLLLCSLLVFNLHIISKKTNIRTTIEHLKEETTKSNKMWCLLYCTITFDYIQRMLNK